MGLFGRHKEGGIMDAIRCDEKDYLIWKWRPNSSSGANSSKKENNIRYGSSLNVRPGQAAIFLYQNNGSYDVIKGPYNGVIKTDNLPVLASVIGLAYAGGTPFQAEVYFINLAKGMEIPFHIPFFRVIPVEPEYKVYDIQVAIDGTLAFEVSTEPEYIKYMMEAWGGCDTQLAELEEKMKVMLTQEVKQIITNAPRDTGIFVMHFNSLIGEMGPYILARLQNNLAHRFGVLASGVYLSDIRYDEDSTAFQRLKRITEEQTQLFNLENEKTALLSMQIKRDTMQTDSEVRNQTTRKIADIQMGNTEDMLAKMREEAQFAQHMQSQEAARQTRLGSESAYINAHALNQQTEVLKTGAQSLGEMGNINMGGNAGGMNPAGAMTGMMMGAAVAGQMGKMMNQMGSTLAGNMSTAGQPNQTPPPIPGMQPQMFYYLYVNNAQTGPFDLNSIAQLVQNGQVDSNTPAWSEGMEQWAPMKSIPSLAAFFQASPVPGSVPPPYKP